MGCKQSDGVLGDIQKVFYVGLAGFRVFQYLFFVWCFEIFFIFMEAIGYLGFLVWNVSWKWEVVVGRECWFLGLGIFLCDECFFF